MSMSKQWRYGWPKPSVPKQIPAQRIDRATIHRDLRYSIDKPLGPVDMARKFSPRVIRERR